MGRLQELPRDILSPRQSWDEYFIGLAHAAASRSTCPRLSVGCVIVDQKHRVNSTGYNGSKPGEPHCSDVGCDIQGNKCKRTIHAEDNAIRHANHAQLSGSILYCTHVPCHACTLLILKSGVIEVVFAQDYKEYASAMKPLYDYHGVVFRQYAVVTEEEVM